MRRLLALLTILSALCAAAPIRADPLPSGWVSHRFNGPNQPTVADGVVTFHIFDRQCSDVTYGDGRGESDCLNGNVRSTIRRQGNDGRLGETLTYRFDLWIDPSFAFAPFRNPDAIGLLAGGMDSRLRVASWEGTFLHNFIYIMKADRERGITFAGAQCQRPEDFGTWVAVSVAIRWANDQRGWIRVTCDDRLVYADEDVATNQAPHCYSSNQCEPGVAKDPRRFIFLLGPVVGGYGRDHARFGFATPFVDIQPDGILIRARNMSITRGGENYASGDRAMVADLQRALNDLGCDVGPADGIAGRRTKAAVLACRDFGQDMPGKLTLATLPRFLDLYRSERARTAPVGKTGDAQPRVVAGIGGLQLIPNGDVALGMAGRVERSAGDTMEFGIILVGRFDARGNTPRLDVLLRDDVEEKVAAAARRCPGVRTETWGDGSNHVVLGYDASASGLRARGADCLVAALPAKLGEKLSFVVDGLGDLAALVVRDGGADAIDHPGLVAFLDRVARGEIALTR